MGETGWHGLARAQRNRPTVHCKHESRELWPSVFPDLPILRRFLQDKYPDIRLAGIFTREALQGRGQMGVYWLDMLQGQERAHR